MLVLVQGHHWEILIADAPKDGGVVLSRYQMMGQTDRVLGICKLVASIPRIVRYACEECKTWFVSSISKMNVKF